MVVLARIFGVAGVGSVLGVGVGCAVFGVPVDSGGMLPVFVLGCVGGIVGAIAGVGVEVVVVLREGRVGRV